MKSVKHIIHNDSGWEKVWHNYDGEVRDQVRDNVWRRVAGNNVAVAVVQFLLLETLQ